MLGRGVRAEPDAIPDLALQVLRLAEQRGAAFGGDNQPGVGLGETGEVIKVTVVPVDEIGVAVARPFQCGGHDGDATAQQHAQRAVQPGQLEHPHVFSNGRDAPELPHQTLPEPATAPHEQAHHHRHHQTQQHRPVLLDRLPPLQHEARHEGQFVAHVFIDVRKAWHHIAHEKQDDQAAHADQHDGVDGRTHQLVAQGLQLVAIGDIAAQCLAQVAGALAGSHRGHKQGGKGLGHGLQRAGKRVAFAQAQQQLLQHRAHRRPGFFLGQRFHRLHDAHARAQQRQQFLAEQQQREIRPGS
ncbi:hypothetical protein FQZ97_846080 [compost metagenome]